MPEQALTTENTNHPFIVRNKDICNGSPIIDGTRTRAISPLNMKCLGIHLMKLSVHTLT